MAQTTIVTYGGVNDGDGTSYNTDQTVQSALFARKFGGEILTEFMDSNVFMDKHYTRTLTEGKSAKFPVFGQAGSEYFTPGNDLYTDQSAEANDYLKNIRRGERLIWVNDLCVAPTFVDELDELRDDYNGVRQIYAAELGRALAVRYDTNVCRAIQKAAKDTAAVTGGPAGGDDVIIDLAGGTNTGNPPASTEEEGDRIAAGLYEAAQKFDEADVPKEGRWTALTPSAFYKLVQSSKAINVDYRGEGSFAAGEVRMVAGIKVIMSNHIPSTNETANQPAGENNALYGDQSTSIGVVWHESAVGTVKMMDMGFEMEYDVSRQGWLLVAKMAVGHGVLRPEAAIRLLSE